MLRKKNLITTDSRNNVERSFDVEYNIFSISMQEEVNLSSFHHQEEKEATKLFHITIQGNNTKLDAMFDLGLHDSLCYCLNIPQAEGRQSLG